MKDNLDDQPDGKCSDGKEDDTSEDLKIDFIIKRDGRTVPFEIQKIANAIFKAAESAGGKDQEKATILAEEVLRELKKEFMDKSPTVENIQDTVEKVLIEHGHAKTAKAFILYRHKKSEERRNRDLILGEAQSMGNLNFSNQALKILERRYLLKDINGNIIETPQQMLRRAAKNTAYVDSYYGKDEEEISAIEEEFYKIMAELKFLPNSPTLMNSGKKNQQLSSCVVLPIEDKLESIFDTLKDAALIHQRGSGTGFSFSRLRPKGDFVKMHQGVASGPVDFLKVYDRALESIKQGGVRPGANMAVLRVDHPDIIRFIESKRDKKSLKNFNISVAVTDRFMKAVETDREYYLYSPKIDKYIGRLRARDVFSIITQNAWKTGDPGLIFIDEINRKHPVKHLGEIETTNQCGEAPLLPNEGCVLGSINLNKFVIGEISQQEDLIRNSSDKSDLENGKAQTYKGYHEMINWEDLKVTIHTAVHFLDNVIDVNTYAKPEIEEITKRTRKFGLGIMGLADVLCKLKIKYDSEEGLEFADQLMSFIKEETYNMSAKLADERGVCAAWNGSDHQRFGRKMRNATCLSISPTGTISILADASSGCEPLFSISYQKTVFGDSELIYLNKDFEEIAKERGFYSPELIHKIAKIGTIQGFKEIPKDVRNIFVTAQDISPEWHVKMQATLQKYIDNSISKTINFPNTASIRDVENAYLFAWKSKCKGITIYRDGSYEEQVMNIGEG